MCTYLTTTSALAGAGLKSDGEWFTLRNAVVYFDHPQEAPVDHALCIDFRGDVDGFGGSGGSGGSAGDASTRVAVELDAASARRLAESILATLDSDEVLVLEGRQGR
jgi:hypothetical protein